MKNYLYVHLGLVFIQSGFEVHGATHKLMTRGSMPNQMIACFLDAQEYMIEGAITGGLLTVLYQNACPIIVSKSLLVNVLFHKEHNKALFFKHTTNLAKIREKMV